MSYESYKTGLTRAQTRKIARSVRDSPGLELVPFNKATFYVRGRTTENERVELSNFRPSRGFPPQGYVGVIYPSRVDLVCLTDDIPIENAKLNRAIFEDLVDAVLNPSK